jgi:hypothetical protein
VHSRFKPLLEATNATNRCHPNRPANAISQGIHRRRIDSKNRFVAQIRHSTFFIFFACTLSLSLGIFVRAE